MELVIARQDKFKLIIEKYNLIEHPEGGWYRETLRTTERVTVRPGVNRPLCTLIYYLLPAGVTSRIHRVASDETWLFHEGDPLELMLYDPSGQAVIQTQVLGTDINPTIHLQFKIPKNTWFNARIAQGGSYALAACLVSPGFEFEDLEFL